MFNRAPRDAFAFSLGGMTTVSSVVAAPAIAGDRLNRAWDERLSRTASSLQRRRIMSNEFKRPRDAFTFSLGGLATVAMFAFSPAISGDRINRLRDERMKQVPKGLEKPGFWRSLRRQPA